MRDLLFLAHRIPYPPDKGDKIRSFHMLKGLAKHYRVHLGAFVDDPEDLHFVEHLRSLCRSVYLPRLRPLLGQIRGIPSALGGEPLSLARYQHTRFARWVSSTLHNYPISAVYAFSAAVGRYALLPAPRPLHRVIDFVDVDSEKWRQYAEINPFPMSWIYEREYKTLGIEERRLAERFGASVFVTEEEAALFRKANPDIAQRVRAIGNGIDLTYFDPTKKQPNPYQEDGQRIIFTGAMDYQANIEGVVWFCRNVWPAILAQSPKTRFYIVGQRPAPAVQALAREPRVNITGRVSDVRPYLAHADVVCAPLRVARGVQNKVLEALAMGRPVVGTMAAWEGLGHFEAFLGERVDDAGAFARAVLLCLSEPKEGTAQRRNWLASRFSWERSVENCISLLDAPHEGVKNLHTLAVAKGQPG